MVLNKTMTLNKYSFDFSNYEEKARHLGPFKDRTMHKIDYWSGYLASRGKHKGLIVSSFNQLEVLQNFISFSNLHLCSNQVSNPKVIYGQCLKSTGNLIR